MSPEQRLIDANALSDKVDESKYDNPHPQGMIRVNHRNEHDHFLRMILDAPTVDAVEVVRCKDCEKWKCHGMPFDITKGTCYNPRFHFHHGHVLNECFMPVTNETDFCSYGERRAT